MFYLLCFFFNLLLRSFKFLCVSVNWTHLNFALELNWNCFVRASVTEPDECLLSFECLSGTKKRYWAFSGFSDEDF